jgi:hypothetical protein
MELEAASLDEIIVGVTTVRCWGATIRSRDARFIYFNLHMTAVAAAYIQCTKSGRAPVQGLLN